MLSHTRIWWIITIDRYRSWLYYSSGPAEGDFHVDLRGGGRGEFTYLFYPSNSAQRSMS
jgi:hypothetical protein